MQQDAERSKQELKHLAGEVQEAFPQNAATEALNQTHRGEGLKDTSIEKLQEYVSRFDVNNRAE